MTIGFIILVVFFIWNLWGSRGGAPIIRNNMTEEERRAIYEARGISRKER